MCKLIILKTPSQKYFFYALSVKWALLAKKRRGPDIFRPLQCQTRGGAAPRPPRDRRLCHQMYTNIGFGLSGTSLGRFCRLKSSQNLSKFYVIKNYFSKANKRFFSSFFSIFENQCNVMSNFIHV